mgnify:CR=1 FL=1
MAGELERFKSKNVVVHGMNNLIYEGVVESVGDFLVLTGATVKARDNLAVGITTLAISVDKIVHIHTPPQQIIPRQQQKAPAHAKK